MRLAGLVLAPALTACVGVAAPPSCTVGEAMIETQLYFGMSKPEGGLVSQRDFDAFVAREISPRFADGFSVFDGAGFWRDRTTQKTMAEGAKLLVRLHPPSAAADQAIDDIVERYKAAFAQQAVLRVDRPVCARFE